MKRIFSLWYKLSKRLKKGLTYSYIIIGGLSTLLSLLGVTLNDFNNNIILNIFIIISSWIVLGLVIYFIIGRVYKDKASLKINNNRVDILRGDIFKIDGMKVIGCDNHFDTRIDDKVIAKKSLHGQLVLKHGNKESIRKLVKSEAEELGIMSNKKGEYEFSLGKIIPYKSEIDNQTYLLLAMTKLNDRYEAHTNIEQYEQMLMVMWKEISRVYAFNDIVLPILGTGITRFEHGFHDPNSLLRCMLCTLKGSGVYFNSQIKIVIFDKSDDFSLFEYKSMFND